MPKQYGKLTSVLLHCFLLDPASAFPDYYVISDIMPIRAWTRDMIDIERKLDNEGSDLVHFLKYYYIQKGRIL